MAKKTLKGVIGNWCPAPCPNNPDSTMVERVLAVRGITGSAVDPFLNPTMEADPMFGRVQGLADWLIRLPPGAAMISGDYDVDGTTSCRILGKMLNRMGWEVGAWVPDRFTDNYGINYGVLESEFKAAPYSLLVTADCGATELDGLQAFAEKHQIQVMVVDHHRRKGVGGPLVKELNHLVHADLRENSYSAAVLGLMLAEQVGRHQQPVQETLPELRVLAGLSAMADVVSMQAIGTRFAAQACLNTWDSEKANVGLRYLIGSLGLKGAISSSEIGYNVSPLINAAGRLAHARIILELLNAQTTAEAAKVCTQLVELNQKRRDLQAQVEAEAVRYHVPGQKALVVYRETWHPGVVGPAAGRLVEKLGIPVFLGGCLPDKEMVTFSGRSNGRVDIHQAFTQCAAGLPVHFGGHAVAMGFRVGLQDAPQVIPELSKRFESNITFAPPPTLCFDCSLQVSSVCDQTYALFQKLEPFGTDNPRPLFRVPDVRMELTPLRRYPESASGVSMGAGGCQFPVVVFKIKDVANRRNIKGDVIGELIGDSYKGSRTVKMRVADVVER